MKPWALDYLACPETGSPLVLRDAVCEEGEILSGTLVNSAGRAYIVRRGVPQLGLAHQSGAEARTVAAFGEQWGAFETCRGFMASRELFFSFFPTLTADEFRGKTALEAGCGNGRWLPRMAQFGARHVIGLDYSESVSQSWHQTRVLPNVTVVQGSILRPPLARNAFDLVVSMGVIHHLDDPLLGMTRLGELLVPSYGKIAVWVYAREGNELYLALVAPLRKLCPRLPAPLLLLLSRGLAVPVWLHAHTLGRWLGIRRDGSFRLPMAGYFDLLRRLSFRDVVNIVHDQLTPQLARYYRRHEVEALFAGAGLTLVACETPRGNSYSAAGVRRRADSSIPNVA